MTGLVGTSLFPDVFVALKHVVEQRQSLVFLGDMRAPGSQHEHGYGPPVPNPDDVRRLALAITKLPRADRLALTLHYLDGLSDADIACLVGTDRASAASMRRSALRRIAKAG